MNLCGFIVVAGILVCTVHAYRRANPGESELEALTRELEDLQKRNSTSHVIKRVLKSRQEQILKRLALATGQNVDFVKTDSLPRNHDLHRADKEEDVDKPLPANQEDDPALLAKIVRLQEEILSESKEVKGREYLDSSELVTGLVSFVRDKATPAEISLLHRIRNALGTLGLATTSQMIDRAFYGKEDFFIQCGVEHTTCDLAEHQRCAKDGKFSVIYGADDGVRVKEKTYPETQRTMSCGNKEFGDPAPGSGKTCKIRCSNGAGQEVIRASSCPTTPGVKVTWAEINLCDRATINPNSEEEDTFQDAIRYFCKHEHYRKGMKVWLNCRFQNAFARAIGKDSGALTSDDLTSWMDRAWVTYFKGDPNGLRHSMMVTNLLRTCQFFSDFPVIVYVVGEENLCPDWDPVVFPNLILFHADPITEMLEPDAKKVSFNFNKFRAMLLRLRTGVQLDADMIIAPFADKLFAATEREVNKEYPFPIMPVHWMTRYKQEGKVVDSYPNYAVKYPGDGKNDPQFAQRVRWAHCHPTWTFHALPFLADVLLAKLSYDNWKDFDRVVGRFGFTPEATPRFFMNEDEDLLNVLLWRHRKYKLWCKWDLEWGLFPHYYGQSQSDRMVDSVWFKDGVPLMFLGAHNTKNTIGTDTLINKLARVRPPPGYIHLKGKYYASPEEFRAEYPDIPCLLA
eukprot:m.72583 g.72583  ORF g.72583 m.72583 type:complete len:682 (-) comp12336_c0_seq1:18-2063(-)